jgi:hypothetical protein
MRLSHGLYGVRCQTPDVEADRHAALSIFFAAGSRILSGFFV